jgi:hypothetical protein
LKAAGFELGKTVLAPAIGGSVGNATTQLARALGAKHAISTTTSHAKAEQAKERGFSEVIDLSEEGLAEGVRRLTDGYGADIVVDAIGGQILSEALEILAPNGNLTTLGYAAGRKTTIDVTDLIWKRASIKSFSLFHQPLSARSEAWKTITEFLGSGQVEPIVAKTFPLEDAANALRYLIDARPFGRVIVMIWVDRDHQRTYWGTRINEVVGSILRPASFCGCIGFKPSVGGINRGGSYDYFSQSSTGVLAASLEDAWLVAVNIAARVGGDPGYPGLQGPAEPPPSRRPRASRSAG